MDINLPQYHFLKRLEAKGGTPTLLKDLKPDLKPKDRRDALVADGLVAQGKAGLPVTFALTDAGRRWLGEHPEPPSPPKRAVKPKAPRPPKAPKPPKLPPPPKPVPTFPFPKHRLFLLKLAFASPGLPVDGLSKVVKAAERKELADRKWIVEKTTRPRLDCELTDAGWKWVGEHFADAVGGGAAEGVLSDVLARVGTYLSANGQGLADLLRAKATPPASAKTTVVDDGDDNGRGTAPGRVDPATTSTPDAGPMTSGGGGDVAAAIGAACLRLSHGQVNVRVRLADLREALPGLAREAVDRALADLAERGDAILYGLDDPREIEPRDEAAAFVTDSGHRRHTVYWQRK